MDADIIRDDTAGDPMRPGVRWTDLSWRRIWTARIGRRFRVGAEAVTQRLQSHCFGRRKAQKERSAKRHPQRDQPFRKIARLRATADVPPGDYPTGEKAPAGYKKAMRILFDEELPAWNYRAVPIKRGS